MQKSGLLCEQKTAPQQPEQGGTPAGAPPLPGRMPRFAVESSLRTDIQVSNMGETVSGLRGGCNDISLRTSFASIKIGLPASQGYNVDARTSFGSISTDIPITIMHKSENTLTGTIGSGGCRLTLSDNNGNITVGRE